MFNRGVGPTGYQGSIVNPNECDDSVEVGGVDWASGEGEASMASRLVQRMAGPRKPNEAEVRQRETISLPRRNWRACVQGRGKNKPHWTRWPGKMSVDYQLGLHGLRGPGQPLRDSDAHRRKRVGLQVALATMFPSTSGDHLVFFESRRSCRKSAACMEKWWRLRTRMRPSS